MIFNQKNRGGFGYGFGGNNNNDNVIEKLSDLVASANKIFEYLIESGADYTLKNNKNNNILHILCKSEANLEIIKKLKLNDTILTDLNKNFDSPIRIAINKMDVDTFRYFCSVIEDINKQDANKSTLLSYVLAVDRYNKSTRNDYANLHLCGTWRKVVDLISGGHSMM